MNINWNAVFRTVIALVVTLGVLFFIFSMAFKPFPEANKDFVMAGAGALIPLLTLVIQFYFRKSGPSGTTNGNGTTSTGG